MGYDLHITRAQDWTDSDTSPITRDEWGRIVEADTELGPDPDNGPDDFLFISHPVEPWPFWWYNGEVYTKNPDQPTVKKMIELAKLLKAKVQGDDGETYNDWTKFPEASE